MEQLVADIRKHYLSAFSKHMRSADGTPFYTADLVMFGLMDRNIGLVEAMPELFLSKNIHALAPLLRVQLDGLLRLHAFHLVENMDELASHMIEGKELRKFKDRCGEKLSDRYLVNSLKREMPWVETMYTTLSGWVHLSESHVFAAASKGIEERTINIGIGGYRENLPPQLFEEAMVAITSIHTITADLIDAYFERRKAYREHSRLRADVCD